MRSDLEESMSPRDARDAAAYLIERHGWRQSTLGSPEQGFSLFGAVAQATAGERTRVVYGHKLSALGTFVFKQLTSELGVENLWQWHESSARTKNDVVKALRGMQ